MTLTSAAILSALLFLIVWVLALVNWRKAESETDRVRQEAKNLQQKLQKKTDEVKAGDELRHRLREHDRQVQAKIANWVEDIGVTLTYVQSALNELKLVRTKEGSVSNGHKEQAVKLLESTRSILSDLEVGVDNTLEDWRERKGVQSKQSGSASDGTEQLVRFTTRP